MSIKCRRISHFKTRLMERFGIKISDELLNQISIDIFNYKYPPIWISMDGINSFHRVSISNNVCVILYDWESDCLTTVYRESWFDIDQNGTVYPRSSGNKKSKEIRNTNRCKTYRDKYMGIFDLF